MDPPTSDYADYLCSLPAVEQNEKVPGDAQAVPDDAAARAGGNQGSPGLGRARDEDSRGMSCNAVSIGFVRLVELQGLLSSVCL